MIEKLFFALRNKWTTQRVIKRNILDYVNKGIKKKKVQNGEVNKKRFNDMKAFFFIFRFMLYNTIEKYNTTPENVNIPSCYDYDDPFSNWIYILETHFLNVKRRYFT